MPEQNDDEDIRALFEKVAGHFEGADDSSRAMFSMLVKTALKYRDILMHSSGIALTVAETREALGVFMEVLKTHQIPQTVDKHIKDLVVLWLEELKTHVHH